MNEGWDRAWSRTRARRLRLSTRMFDGGDDDGSDADGFRFARVVRDPNDFDLLPGGGTEDGRWRILEAWSRRVECGSRVMRMLRVRSGVMGGKAMKARQRRLFSKGWMLVSAQLSGPRRQTERQREDEEDRRKVPTKFVRGYLIFIIEKWKVEYG